ncbi:phage tail tube protein [Brevundimonas sp. 2R-24]|uniref:Phage tail tube protein n=1 Tax=Peiella sedimenti TaxID=3061083 RepID=A0ABT8SMM8_9CAUL|nr:phage tail tube protein [Caulobacteraceae bacterium XZ-24]
MATIQNVLGETFLIQIGDGAETEVFAHPALINTKRSINFSTNVESDELVDISDQSAPAQTVRRVRSTDLKVDGSGLIHGPALNEWVAWSLSGEVKNVKVTKTGAGASGGFTITGPFVLTGFQIDAERVKSAECQITLEQAGALTYAATA